MKKKIVSIVFVVLSLIVSVAFVACNSNKHEAKAEWKSDEAKHWHECATKGHEDKLDEAEHTFADWTVKTPAGYGTKGEEEAACSVCGYKTTREVAALQAKDNVVTVDEINFVYNGKSQAIDSLISASNAEGMAIKYKAEDATEFTVTAPVNAGSYVYQITVPATAEWKQVEKTGTFTIEQYTLKLPKNYFEDSVAMINASGESNELYDFFSELEETDMEEAILYTPSPCGVGRHKIAVKDLKFLDKNFKLDANGFTEVEWLITDDGEFSVTVTDSGSTARYAYIKATVTGGVLTTNDCLVNIKGSNVYGQQIDKIDCNGYSVKTVTKGETVTIFLVGTLMTGGWTSEDSNIVKCAKAEFGAVGSGSVNYDENETKYFVTELPATTADATYDVSVADGFTVTVYNQYGMSVKITDGKINVAADASAMRYTIVVKRTGAVAQFNAYIK